MTDLTMSQFASKDDLLAAQAARIAELESQLDAIGAGGVEPLRKQAAQAVHQIAEPAAPVGKPIKDAIDALVMAAFTEGGCSEHRMSEARIQTELRKKELCTLLSTPQPCSRSHPHEEMTPMCELRTEIARLTNALARAEAAAPQAVQAAVPETREALAKRLIADVQVADTIATAACQRVAELPDRDSPADWPEAMLVTGDELHMIVREAVIEAQAAPAHPAEEVPAQAAVPVVRGEVLVTVSGFTGSGKSAIAGEIEIMCRALGLQVEWPDGVTEKNMTHADWTTALELYNPRVRIIERNVPRNTASGADQ